jgi:hypothetical protein
VQLNTQRFDLDRKTRKLTPVLCFQTLNPVKHLRPPRQQATGVAWSSDIAPQMADGGSSRGPHPARPGYMCCRACTAESTAPRSTVRFKLIPEGPCAKAGARYAGAAAVHGLHGNSRWWCVSHHREAERHRDKDEAVIVDIITPSALPADRFCAVCARLLVNQRGGSEYEQVADACCEVMCAHCAGEKFVSCLQQGMHCGACNNEVLGWTVRAPPGSAGRRVEAPPPHKWRQYPRLRAMHDGAMEGDVGVQVIWYDDKNEALTCTSNFNVCGDPDQLLRASARSGILQLARLLNLLLRRNTPVFFLRSAR